MPGRQRGMFNRAVPDEDILCHEGRDHLTVVEQVWNATYMADRFLCQKAETLNS